MPTYLRRFYLKQLVDLKKEERAQYNKETSKNQDPRLVRK
jgi:hypothetical protein